MGIALVREIRHYFLLRIIAEFIAFIVVVVVQVVVVRALPKESDSTGEQAAPKEQVLFPGDTLSSVSNLHHRSKTKELDSLPSGWNQFAINQAADPDAANEIVAKKAILRNKRSASAATPASATPPASVVHASVGQTTHGPSGTSSGLFTSKLTNTISLIYAIFMI